MAKANLTVFSSLHSSMRIKAIPGAGKGRILVESEVVGDGLVIGQPAVRPDRTGLRYTNLQGQLP